MIIVSNYFNYWNTKDYDTLAMVLSYSVKKNCPNAKLILTKLKAPDLHGKNRSFQSNTVKIEDWVNKLSICDEDTILMDCDMMVLNDISEAFKLKKLFDLNILFENIDSSQKIKKEFFKNGIDISGKVFLEKKSELEILLINNNTNHPIKYLIQKADTIVSVYEYWDIGYCKRTSGNLPFNGGVVFVRNTQSAKDFIKYWYDINYKMYKDSSFHNPWRKKYAGMNQAAFGWIWERGVFTAALKEFDCQTWNSCREDWSTINDKTMIIHVKSELRKLALHGIHPDKVGIKYKAGLTLWWKLLKECVGDEKAEKTIKQIDEVNQERKKRKFEKLKEQKIKSILIVPVVEIEKIPKKRINSIKIHIRRRNVRRKKR